MVGYSVLHTEHAEWQRVRSTWNLIPRLKIPGLNKPSVFSPFAITSQTPIAVAEKLMVDWWIGGLVGRSAYYSSTRHSLLSRETCENSWYLVNYSLVFFFFFIQTVNCMLRAYFLRIVCTRSLSYLLLLIIHLGHTYRYRSPSALGFGTYSH